MSEVGFVGRGQAAEFFANRGVRLVAANIRLVLDVEVQPGDSDGVVLRTTGVLEIYR